MRNTITMFFVFFVACSQSIAQDSWEIRMLPSPNLMASRNEFSGWGYEIKNNSTTNWLEVGGILTSGGVFQYGILNFDFYPYQSLFPGQTISVNFQNTNYLASFTFDNNAPDSFTNVGSIDVAGDWYDNDPGTVGVFVGPADTKTLSYSATVQSSVSAPEPTSAVLLATPLVTIAAVNGLKKKLKKDKKKEKAQG
jgi:hypothetical protein